MHQREAVTVHVLFRWVQVRGWLPSLGPEKASCGFFVPRPRWSITDVVHRRAYYQLMCIYFYFDTEHLS